jgi:hypothetical protein
MVIGTYRDRFERRWGRGTPTSSWTFSVIGTIPVTVAEDCADLGATRECAADQEGKPGAAAALGLRIRQRANQATDLKGNWSEKPRFRALSVQCPEEYRLWA